MNAPRSDLAPTVTSILLVLTSISIAGPLAAQDPVAMEPASEDRSPAHTHIHHVSVTFRGTPDDQGLLATAIAEAEIAHQHATFAARDPSDVTSVRRHVGHVLHALDPSAVESGPGQGYGAVRAAERTAHYISLAAASDGATDAIETHSTHIETAARHAMSNGEAAVALAREILAATTPAEEEGDAEAEEGDEEAAGAEEDADEEEAADEEETQEEPPPDEEAEEPLDVPAAVSELVSLTRAMVEGVDANGDGRVGWQKGEGGLAQATQHLELLRRAEGLTGS